jgi:hypothetical protein
VLGTRGEGETRGYFYLLLMYVPLNSLHVRIIIAQITLDIFTSIGGNASSITTTITSPV